MSKVWQLQEAKNKLSEVVHDAVSEGPQEITRHGMKAAVIMSYGDYQRLRRRRGSLGEFLKRSPLRGLDLTRTKDLPRELEL